MSILVQTIIDVFNPIRYDFTVPIIDKKTGLYIYYPPKPVATVNGNNDIPEEFNSSMTLVPSVATTETRERLREVLEHERELYVPYYVDIRGTFVQAHYLGDDVFMTSNGTKLKYKGKIYWYFVE